MRLTEPNETYRAALAATAPTRPPALEPGSDAERAAVERVRAFYDDFTLTNVEAQVRQVYAADAYMRDPFHEVSGIDAVVAYFTRSADGLRSCRFRFDDVASKDGETYLRWVMESNLKRDPPERVERMVGMSHIRFNAAGQIIFHQDYWDPSDVLYARIPVAGWMIRKVKARL